LSYSSLRKTSRGSKFIIMYAGAKVKRGGSASKQNQKKEVGSPYFL